MWICKNRVILNLDVVKFKIIYLIVGKIIKIFSEFNGKITKIFKINNL
jgi:hypothetical protein